MRNSKEEMPVYVNYEKTRYLIAVKKSEKGYRWAWYTNREKQGGLYAYFITNESSVLPLMETDSTRSTCRRFNNDWYHCHDQGIFFIYF